jgi:sec-independent protein translocase protein TatC
MTVPYQDPTSQPLQALPDKTAQSWQGHLLELRARLIWSGLALIVATCAAFFGAEHLIRLLQALAPQGVTFIQVAPGEVFFAALRLSIFAGIGVALPVILYHVVRFVAPGLRPQERRYLLPFIILTAIFFALGVLVGYAVVLPLMLTFLYDYGAQVAENQSSVATYINFCTGFLFAMGLVFELPMVLLFASWLGLLTYDKLVGMWRGAIVGSVILAAIVTPSADPFSQIVVSVILIALYGVSLLLIKVLSCPSTKTASKYHTEPTAMPV